MRKLARERYDHFRTLYVLSYSLAACISVLIDKCNRLMHEPRGHKDMYGAIIIPETEMTRKGEADVGVLFMHNGTYPFLLLAFLILIFDSSFVLFPEFESGLT